MRITMRWFLETYTVKMRDEYNWLRVAILLHCQFLKHFLSSFFVQNDIYCACGTYGGEEQLHTGF